MTPHLSALERDAQFSTGLFFHSPTPLPRFHHPLIRHKISSLHCWLRFFFPGSGDEKADESALLWIHVHSLFPQRSPRTASVHLLLQCPTASQPAPAPHAFQAGPRLCSHSLKETENILRKEEKQQKGSPPPTQPRTHSLSCWA